LAKKQLTLIVIRHLLSSNYYRSRLQRQGEFARKSNRVVLDTK